MTWRATEAGVQEQVDQVNECAERKGSPFRLCFGHRYTYFGLELFRGSVCESTLITGTKKELSIYLSGVLQGFSFLGGAS